MQRFALRVDFADREVRIGPWLPLECYNLGIAHGRSGSCNLDPTSTGPRQQAARSLQVFGGVDTKRNAVDNGAKIRNFGSLCV